MKRLIWIFALFLAAIGCAALRARELGDGILVPVVMFTLLSAQVILHILSLFGAYHLISKSEQVAIPIKIIAAILALINLLSALYVVLAFIYATLVGR